MERHVRVLAWLYIVHAVLYVLIGLAGFVALSAMGSFFGRFDPGGEMPLPAGRMLAVLGGGLAAVMVMISIPRLLAGIGLLWLRPWSRILTLVLATLGFVDFPVGSGIGAYAYWVLLSREGAALFEGNPGRPPAASLQP
jgi:hypothetical protein